MADHFARFTERARSVFSLAREEARRLDHTYVGTEHLLLGLVREGDGVAARALADLGVRLPKVRAAVEFIIGRGEGMVAGEPGLTPQAKAVIELAMDEARRLDSPDIGTEHLLLGLIAEGEGDGARILESLGVGREQARRAVTQVLARPLPDQSAQANRAVGSAGDTVSDEGHQAGPAVMAGAVATAWGAQTVATATPGASDDPPPTLERLLRVIPIVQAGNVGDATITLIALEAFADGFIVTMQLNAPVDGHAPHRHPQVAIEARDDRDGRYAGWTMGSGGTSDGRTMRWRGVQRFTPPLDPGAKRLTLALGIGWRGMRGSSRNVSAVAVGDPWVVIVPLWPTDGA